MAHAREISESLLLGKDFACAQHSGADDAGQMPVLLEATKGEVITLRYCCVYLFTLRRHVPEGAMF